jgi:hypothetical protein
MVTPPPLDPTATVEAILSAFNERQLASLLRFKGGMVLDEVVDTGQPYRLVAEDLVVELGRNDDLDRLVSIALRERPGNPKLQKLAQTRGLPGLPEPPAAAAGPSQPALGTMADFVGAARKMRPADAALAAAAAKVPAGSAPANAPAADGVLEAQIARRSVLIDFGRFGRRMDQIEKRICLVRTPEKLGTGFLVGPAMVLTNFHVVEGLLRSRYAFGGVECRFDYNSTTEDPRRVGLAGPPVASAPYGESDLRGEGSPATGELDYALLPLAEPLGMEGRGWYALDPFPRLVALNDFIFVCQHAKGNELQLAFGTVTDFPANALRIRYDVTTEGGSSGSPCFTPELDLVGLHHAAEPGSQPHYNQGVPLWLVAKHAAAAGVVLAGAPGGAA